MDVVLLTSILSTTNRLYRPWGAYQLAWYLRKHGYEVQVLDFLHKFEKAEILALIEKFIAPETKIVGWNCMFMPGHEKWWVKMICEEIIPTLRRRHPQVKFVTGGASVHQVNRLYRSRRVFDYLFYGHAEDTLLAYCDHVYRGKALPAVEIVLGNKGIREGAALPLTGRGRFRIEDCDHVWHETDCIQPGESLPIEMARGCIFKCKFCRYPYIGKSKDDFRRSMELVRDELTQNYERFGTRHYYMLEDTFNDSNDKVDAFWAMSRELPFNIGFAAYLRPDLIYSFPGQAQKLQEAGLLSGFLGVESLSPAASRLIGKAWSGQHARSWLPKLYHEVWAGQVTFRTSLIIGIPPDTREDLLATHQWAVDNGMPNWKWHVLNINRDHQSTWISEFDKHADDYGFGWYTERGHTRWKTEQMTWREAKDLQTELETVGKPYQMQDCWGLIERGTYGYDLVEDRHQRIVEMDRKDAAKRRKGFLRSYYDQVMALPGA